MLIVDATVETTSSHWDNFHSAHTQSAAVSSLARNLSTFHAQFPGAILEQDRLQGRCELEGAVNSFVTFARAPSSSLAPQKGNGRDYSFDRQWSLVVLVSVTSWIAW